MSSVIGRFEVSLRFSGCKIYSGPSRNGLLNRIQMLLVGGVLSHHCAIPAPQRFIMKKKVLKLLYLPSDRIVHVDSADP